MCLPPFRCRAHLEQHIHWTWPQTRVPTLPRWSLQSTTSQMIGWILTEWCLFMLFPLPERTRRDPCIKATNFARTVLWRRSASHHVDRYIRRYGCFGYGFSNWLVWRASFQISSCTFDPCVCNFSSVEIFWPKEELWITERAEIERREAWWPHLHRSFHPECLGNLYGQGLQAIRWINGLTPRI